MARRRSLWGHSRWLATVVLISVAVTGCGGLFGEDLEYSVYAANYTNEGIVILGRPMEERGEVSDRFRISSGLPGVVDDFYHLGVFKGYPKELPDELTIRWKAATLSNCGRVLKYSFEELSKKNQKAVNRKPRDVYIRKRNCSWSVDDSKVYSKTVDMQAIRASEEYDNADRFIKTPLGGTPTLKIELLFWAADDLEIALSNGRTMIFGQ